MSDLRISEHTKLTGTEEFAAMANGREISMVWLWDLGPKKPETPKKPTAPKTTGKEGDPEFDLAKLDFNEEIETYQAAREKYKRDLKDFADWTRKYGGPYELCQWSCDADDTLNRDPERYCISSRTRGRQDLKNHGLPAGVKPGPAQAENMRRRQEGDADLREARRRDPVFGEQEVRS